ncbi:UNVERIFIED_CONTAM: hypothetical protein GTU68_054659 [Idotea baltica]|nr:hypothetical protein [Idotea baltica]
MMQIAFWRNSIASWLLSCAALVITILLLLPSLSSFDPQQVTMLLRADQYSIFFSVLILFAALITALLGKDYLQSRRGENEEFYLLLMLSTLGGLILVSATHLASFLLGLELLGVALYALIGYPERGQLPLEAAVKYLVLSGAASAILLFGFALIYAALGTLSFTGIGEQLIQANAQNREFDNSFIILMGTAMVFAGVGFKLSLVPFHMWTPDVYQGAPSPVTGFLATVSKGAIFAALMRLYVDAQLYQYQGLILGLSALAIASMLAGNLLALKQNNLKRLLAYSSIAHLGYLLITLVIYGSLQRADLAVEAAGFYLCAYVVTSLGAFALLSIISSDSDEQDQIEQLKGLFWRQPLLALLMSVSLLSLAGIPLTVGFVGKFYLFTVAISGSLWLLITALVIGSGIGIYYYLRIIFAMTMQNEEDITEGSALSKTAITVVLVLIASILYLGINPQAFIEYLATITL